MSNQRINLIGVSDSDYRKWCKENNKPIHKKETKEEFFAKILNGKIAKSKRTGELVKKKVG